MQRHFPSLFMQTNKLVAIYKIFNDSIRLNGFIIFKLSNLHFMKENFVQRFSVFIKFSKQKYHHHIHDRSLTQLKPQRRLFCNKKKQQSCMQVKCFPFNFIHINKQKTGKPKCFGEKIAFS